jgi:hypothetical protein
MEARMVARVVDLFLRAPALAPALPKSARASNWRIALRTDLLRRLQRAAGRQVETTDERVAAACSSAQQRVRLRALTQPRTRRKRAPPLPRRRRSPASSCAHRWHPGCGCHARRQRLTRLRLLPMATRRRPKADSTLGRQRAHQVRRTPRAAGCCVGEQGLGCRHHRCSGRQARRRARSRRSRCRVQRSVRARRV